MEEDGRGGKPGRARGACIQHALLQLHPGTVPVPMIHYACVLQLVLTLQLCLLRHVVLCSLVVPVRLYAKAFQQYLCVLPESLQAAVTKYRRVSGL